MSSIEATNVADRSHRNNHSMRKDAQDFTARSLVSAGNGSMFEVLPGGRIARVKGPNGIPTEVPTANGSNDGSPASRAAREYSTTATQGYEVLPGGRIVRLSSLASSENRDDFLDESSSFHQKPSVKTSRAVKRKSFFGKLKAKFGDGEQNVFNQPEPAPPRILSNFSELAVSGTAPSSSSIGYADIRESTSSVESLGSQSSTATTPPPHALESPQRQTTRASILAGFDKDGHWSGRGQHVEFERKETIPLQEGKSLGRGASADVHEVTCLGTTLARKQIYCSRRMKLEDVRRELDILKKLNHKHIVTLVGSYIQGKVLGLLLLPAAVCDLGLFLDEIDDERKNNTQHIGDGLSSLLERLEIAEKSLNSVYRRLERVYGCLAKAVQYLHENKIRHKDLKPRNILLDRNDGLFITDFGISRDNTDASTSITAGMERGTYKYCAPEVAQFEPRGRAADIYSLGCVYLEIRTVVLGKMLTEFEEFRTRDEDHSFQRNQNKVTEWIKLLQIIELENQSIHGTQPVFCILDLIQKMVAERAAARPLIGAVTSNLVLMERLQNGHGENGQENLYFGSCCQVRIHNLSRCERLEEQIGEVARLKKELSRTRDFAQELDKELEKETVRRENAQAEAYQSAKLHEFELEEAVNRREKAEVSAIKSAVETEHCHQRLKKNEKTYQDQIAILQRQLEKLGKAEPQLGGENIWARSWDKKPG